MTNKGDKFIVWGFILSLGLVWGPFILALALLINYFGVKAEIALAVFLFLSLAVLIVSLILSVKGIIYFRLEGKISKLGVSAAIINSLWIIVILYLFYRYLSEFRLQ